ncbi:cullin-like protein (cdc53 family) [Vairimorpha apis BRL 01]|uniref:Cullin-like protein (Cdc53 family) n=1 Tax=Vairimorpha apis BRL 01 TaxID=1037528 RepID=T0MG90_9MICR|nr:cullin-like protein (cdc53 family) [Vairimorpha apis BRL 01]
MEIENLKKLTLKILKNSTKISSSDFIQAYNIIYLHCTSDIDAYEIKGSVIYNTLSEALILHFKSMRPISSLESFYKFISNLNLDIIEKVYSYLSRFYIKINLDKNNNISTIKYLFYTLIYKYGIYSSLKNIEENIIFEISCYRENNSENLIMIKTCIKFLRDLYLFNDNEEDYEKFINSYVYDFNESYSTDIKINIEYINKEMEIFIEFCFSKHKNSTNTNLKNCDFFENYRKISKIILYMSEPYINNFFLKIEEFLKTSLKNIEYKEELLIFFINIKKNFCILNEKVNQLQKKIEIEIIKKFEKFDNVSELILKNRIINDPTSIEEEIQLITHCERDCGSGSVSWIKLILEKYNDPIHYKFKIGNYEKSVKIDVRFLTKIFCNLYTNEIKLWKPLENVINGILYEIKRENPKSSFNVCHEASFVIFEINNIEIKIGLDKFSILMSLSEETNIIKIKEFSKDVNFDKNLEFLILNNLVINEHNKIFINYLYTNKMQKINIFDYKMNEKTKENYNNNREDFSEQTIESLIMKVLKQKKIF